MSVNNFEELRIHVGHKIVCVHYGNPPHYFDDKQSITENVAIEVETCNQLIMDLDKEE